MSRRLFPLITLVAGTLGLAACTEQLESGAGCPLLCPQPATQLRDTLIEAVVVDSSLAGFPALGFEEFPLLANRGDTLETRVIVRFDSLPATYRRTNPVADSAIVRVDSATLVVRLQYPVPDSLATFTVRAYDVDTALPPASAADTAVATLLPLFRADRLLGSVTFVPKSLTDSTVRIPISAAALLAKIRDSTRLRVGLSLEGSGSLALAGQGSPNTLSLRFRADPDTAAAQPVVVLPRSRTPSTDAVVAAALADYQVVVRRIPPPADATLAVGGVPGSRTYLRFELPRSITDSSFVVRAVLLLSQRANLASVRARDTLRLVPEVLIASADITSLERAVRFTSRTFTINGQVIGLSDVPVVPANSGIVSVEIAPLVAAWSSIRADTVPRALVLRAADEGAGGATALFHSREAAAALRPRLRLTYAPRLEFGLP